MSLRLQVSHAQGQHPRSAARPPACFAIYARTPLTISRGSANVTAKKLLALGHWQSRPVCPHPLSILLVLRGTQAHLVQGGSSAFADNPCAAAGTSSRRPCSPEQAPRRSSSLREPHDRAQGSSRGMCNHRTFAAAAKARAAAPPKHQGSSCPIEAHEIRRGRPYLLAETALVLYVQAPP